MPADLPALTRLTEDVAAAMHTAEQAQRRRHGWRRGLPLLVVAIALLIPIALGLRAAATNDDNNAATPPPDQDHAHAFATAAACGAGAGAIAMTARALRGHEGGWTLTVAAPRTNGGCAA